MQRSFRFTCDLIVPKIERSDLSLTAQAKLAEKMKKRIPEFRCFETTELLNGAYSLSMDVEIKLPLQNSAKVFIERLGGELIAETQLEIDGEMRLYEDGKDYAKFIF